MLPAVLTVTEIPIIWFKSVASPINVILLQLYAALIFRLLFRKSDSDELHMHICYAYWPSSTGTTSAWFWERGTSSQEPNLASLANRVWWLCWCCQKAPAFSVHNDMVTVQLFAPNVLPQMPQSVTVKLSVDSLTLGDDFKFNTTLWMLVTTWRSRLDTAGCLDSKV